MKFAKFLICVVGILVFALPAFAQAPTGTLSGRVDDGKEGLPTVLVTITSPNLTVGVPDHVSQSTLSRPLTALSFPGQPASFLARSRLARLRLAPSIFSI